MKSVDIPATMTPIGLSDLEEDLKNIRQRARSAWGSACLIKQGGSMTALETITDDCMWIARLAEAHRCEYQRARVAEQMANEISMVARARTVLPQIMKKIRYIWTGRE